MFSPSADIILRVCGHGAQLMARKRLIGACEAQGRESQLKRGTREKKPSMGAREMFFSLSRPG
jgi:hypothetical protein